MLGFYAEYFFQRSHVGTETNITEVGMAEGSVKVCAVLKALANAFWTFKQENLSGTPLC